MNRQFWYRVGYKLIISLAAGIVLGGSGWSSAVGSANATDASSPPLYGAATNLGPALEPCVTEASQPNTLVVGPNDGWQAVLTNAQPGHTILLRGGTYQASEKLWLPAGAPDQLITIKPYNCEAVTLLASLRPLAYTVLAGLTIEARALADSNYVIRIDSEYKGAYWGNITQVTVRNNLIRGGLTDAIRISDDATAITIAGNLIDGGGTGHNIFVTSEKHLQLPNQILITNNRLSKTIFDTAAEDMFQVRDVGYVEFTYNTCTDGKRMEQCVDIKTTTMPILIAHNFFDGEHLHQGNVSEDGSNGCIVIHEGDSLPDQHVIEQNFFKRCQGAAIRFATSSAGDEISSGLVRANLFYQTSYSHGTIAVAKAQDIELTNNTMICGRLRLGNSEQTHLPTNLLLKNNIFYKTKLEDHTLPTHPYTCMYNLLFQPAGSGLTTSSCANSVDADPHFVLAAAANFYLQPDSPAVQAGEAGTNLGAFPVQVLESERPFTLYLPLIQAITPLAAEITCTP